MYFFKSRKKLILRIRELEDKIRENELIERIRIEGRDKKKILEGKRKSLYSFPTNAEALELIFDEFTPEQIEKLDNGNHCFQYELENFFKLLYTSKTGKQMREITREILNKNGYLFDVVKDIDVIKTFLKDEFSYFFTYDIEEEVYTKHKRRGLLK